MNGRPKLLYLVTEDWFFCSHFKPMARAAIADGFDVAVACRVRAHADEIVALGCRVIPLEAERRSLNPVKIVSALVDARRIIIKEKPDIVHLIALRSIVVGGLAARLAGVRRVVIALTGMGLLGAAETSRARVARAGLRTLIRHVVDGPGTRYLFENRSDPALLGLDADDLEKVLIVGGAGVDPVLFSPLDQPAVPPLKLAIIARMLWSKGVDTAVEAVRLARAKGADVTLTLVGAPDPDNPRAISAGQLSAWAREPGIVWRGRIPQAEAPLVWAAHHAALLPSRGGEGLPRTLLEAAACGRAILTTDVPGCRDLIRDAIEGFVVPPDDAGALSEAILRLAREPALIASMGQAARARVLAGHTEQAVGEAVLALYRSIASAPG